MNVMRRGTTLQAAKKLAFATVSYQGMTLVMPQAIANAVRASAPVVVWRDPKDSFRTRFRSEAILAAEGPCFSECRTPCALSQSIPNPAIDRYHGQADAMAILRALRNTFVLTDRVARAPMVQPT